MAATPAADIDSDGDGIGGKADTTPLMTPSGYPVKAEHSIQRAAHLKYQNYEF